MERYSPFKNYPKPLLRLKPTATHLELLNLMQDYDILPSTYIKSNTYEERCLTQLQKAHWIGVPDGYEHSNAKYRVRPFEIKDLGFNALSESGLLRDRVRMNDHFKHRYLRSVVKFSRDRAKLIPGIAIHSAEDIRAHRNTPADTKADPRFLSIPTSSGFITLDDFWGISLNGRAFMFFYEEDDRGTEPRRSNSTTRHKDIRQMIRDYRDHIDAGEFESRYGLSNVSVLIHTTTDPETIFEIIAEECSAEQAKFFAIKQVPDFLAEPADLPAPTDWLITEPYFRVEDGSIQPFNILDTLTATAERKENVRHQASA